MPSTLISLELEILQRTTLIAVPTYNEVDNIDYLLSSIFQLLPHVHVLIIDDNSNDGTQEKVVTFSESRPGQLFLLGRPGKLGLGTAYLDGFRWALAKGYQRVIQMDADLSHSPSYLHEIIAKLSRDTHLVIGSRYTLGGGTENWSLLRKSISRFGSLYARLILGMRVRDLTGGFNGWRSELLAQIPLDQVRSNGYCFQIEMKYRAFRHQARIEETPIKFVERREGKSKMSGRIVWEAMYKVWLIRFHVR